MHFHSITYNDYNNANTLLDKLNKDLDIQLSKGLVLESNSQNLAVVSNNTQYIFSSLSNLLSVAKPILPTILPIILSGLNSHKEPFNTAQITDLYKNETNILTIVDLMQFLLTHMANTGLKATDSKSNTETLIKL